MRSRGGDHGRIGPGGNKGRQIRSQLRRCRRQRRQRFSQLLADHVPAGHRGRRDPVCAYGRWPLAAWRGTRPLPPSRGRWPAPGRRRLDRRGLQPRALAFRRRAAQRLVVRRRGGDGCRSLGRASRRRPSRSAVICGPHLARSPPKPRRGASLLIGPQPPSIDVPLESQRSGAVPPPVSPDNQADAVTEIEDRQGPALRLVHR